jgi:hypothetical protein
MSESSTKKRKLEKEEEVKDDEMKRLENVFTLTDPLQIIEQLEKLSKDPKNTKILSQLFPESEFPFLNLTEHCVRCHEPYDPNFNSNFRCILGHEGEVMAEQTESGVKNQTDEMLYTWECCNVEWKCSLEDDPSAKDPTKGICFKGNHTSNKNYIENFEPCEECASSDDEQEEGEEEEEE